MARFSLVFYSQKDCNQFILWYRSRDINYCILTHEEGTSFLHDIWYNPKVSKVGCIDPWESRCNFKRVQGTAEACSTAFGKDGDFYLARTSEEGWKNIKKKGWTCSWKGSSLVRARRLNEGQSAASLLRLLRVEVFQAPCCFLNICQSPIQGKLDRSPKKACILGTRSLIVRGKLWLRNRTGHDFPTASGNQVLWSAASWNKLCCSFHDLWHHYARQNEWLT